MTSESKQQKGIASIIVTFSLCIVLSLVIVGFSNIVRRGQRQALDQQLSSQAFYAAESKINTIVAQLNAAATPAQLTAVIDSLKSTNCGSSTDAFNNPSNDAQITCTLIDGAGGSTEYSLGPGDTAVMPIAGLALPIMAMNISWTDGTATVCSEHNDYTKIPSSVDTRLGMVRLNITKADSLARQDLINNTFSALLYPNTNGFYTPTVSPSPYNTTEYFRMYLPFWGDGYSHTAYNVWWDEMNDGETRATRPSGWDGNTSGPFAFWHSINWGPFWNWLDDWRALPGNATAKPKRSSSGPWYNPNNSAQPDYQPSSGTPSNPTLYFRTWATNIINGNNPNYPTGRPESRQVNTIPRGSRVDFAPSTDATKTPVITGACEPGADGKVKGSANIMFNGADQLTGPFYVRLGGLYKASDVVVTAIQTDGTPAEFRPNGATGGQVKLDVTARVRDVVRRVQVRVPVGTASGGTGLPDTALRTSGNLCKQLETDPVATADKCP